MDYIPAIAGTISSIAALISLYFVYKVYKNFDAKKTFTKLQIEEVIKLLNTLQKTKLYIRIVEGDKVVHAYTIYLSTFGKKKKLDSFFKPYSLIFNHDAYQHFDFLNSYTNHILPKSIRDALTEFEYASTIEVDNVNVIKCDNYIYLQLATVVDNYLWADEEKLPKFKNSDSPSKDIIIWSNNLRTLEDFIIRTIKLQESIDKWLSKFEIKN